MQTVKYNSGPDATSSVFMKRPHAEKKTLFLLMFLYFSSDSNNLGVGNTGLFNSLSLRKNIKRERQILTMVPYHQS